MRSSSPFYLVVAFPLEGPQKSGKRTFLGVKIRGHIETLCCGFAGNTRIPELGHQRCIPLVVSMMTLALLDFCSFLTL